MAGKYGWRKDTQKENAQQSKDHTYGWRKDSSVDVTSKVGTDITNRVNTWLQNHNNFIKNYQNRYSGRKFTYEDSYVGDSGDWLDTVNKQSQNFQAEADNILSYLDQYKGYLDSDWAKEVQKTLTESLQQQKSISTVASQDNDWWSNFKDGMEYQTAGRYDGYLKKYSGKEFDEYQKALDMLEDGEEKEWLRMYQTELLRENEDFQEFSKKGAAIANPTFNDAQYNGVLFGLKWGNEDVGNIVTFSRDNWEDIANDMADENLHVVGNYLYHYMQEDEVDIYNYLLAKEGKERAQEFLDSIEDQLNRRAGTGMAQNIMGIDNDILRTVMQGTFGLTAGLDQWTSGTKQFFTGEQLPTTPTQYANAEIYNSLDGLGQNLYTATNVIGNMAPSILVSAVAGGLGVPLKLAQGAGALTMGVSAAGNAYSDALGKGYEKGQARAYSTLVGAAEGGLQYLMGGIGKLGGVGTEKIMSKVAMIDNSLLRISAKLGVDLLGELSEEELQNFLEPALRSIIFGEDYDMPTIEELLETAIVTAITTPILGGKDTIIEDISESKYYSDIYGNSQQELVGEALEIDPNNSYAQKLQGYLDNRKNLNGNQLNRLVQQNEAAMTVQDRYSIQNGAEARLTELGETGDVSAIAAALAKQAAGQKLTKAERATISNSKFGSQVANELNTETINAGEASSEWAQRLDTNRINAQEYSRLVETAQLPQETAEAAREQVVTETPKAAQVAQVEPVQPETSTVRESRTVETQPETTAARDQQVTEESTDTAQYDEGNYFDRSRKYFLDYADGKISAEEYERLVKTVPQENSSELSSEVQSTAESDQQVTEATGKEALQVTEDTPSAVEKLVSLEDVSQKYGAQAQAMVHTYQAGQDVAKYDGAYQVAYDMGKSGVSFDYVKVSQTVSYLTDTQKELAYAAGKAAADTEAQALDTSNKAAANGKTGRKKGVVRGEGVTIADLKQTFNDTQGKAYKYLSTVAEVTGIDIVLYRSEAGPDGKFQGAQGRYSRSEPGTIYIDLNAGLSDIKSADDLAKYAMLRTFAHEFTHFIEKWNPIQYNELRKVVFDTLTDRGENVHDLIEDKQARNPGMSYDKASRELVSEAMTDILPDANFVQELAENHKTIFQKLLDQLKEFVANLRNYYNSIGYNRSKEANALKEQAGDTVKYLDSIVQLFDKVATQAVENYQQTVAEDVDVSKTETTTTVSETESVAVAEEATLAVGDKMEPTVAENAATETDAYDFTISDNVEHGSLEISFDGKPSEAVRNVLKQNKFRWHKAKKVWYGYGNREDITNTLRAAYEAENAEPSATEPEQSDFEKAFWNASQAERDEVVDAINENTKITHMAPTEIRESADAGINEEVTENGENADNQATVQQPEPDGSGAARLLDEVETGDVQADGSSGNVVADTGERGPQAGRDGDRPDTQRSGSGSGEGSSQSGNLRGPDRVTEDVADTNVGSKEAEKLHEEVTQQIAQQSTEKPKGRNFVIGDSLDLPNGEKARYKANVEAIRIVKQLEAEGRYAIEAEQVILSKYVGWGGLANAFDQRKTEWSKEFAELKELLTDEEYASARGSTLNAHFTDISVIKAMYDGLKQLGFTGGRMMEPSSGVGNFVGAMPADMASQVRSWTMVELDGITGLIAKYLYPNADVRIQGFEKANIPNNFMDVAIGNVPFGNYAIADKNYPKKVTSAIHNYFFAKSLDKVRPGGIVMLITSSYTMNSKDNTVRRYIMQKADLLGAIRLPDNAFKGNAGTEVVTDILILKKRAENTAYAGEEFLEAPYQYISGYNGAYINSYFENHPEMVLGTATMAGGMYRGDNLTYKAFTDRGSLADQIREAFQNIQGKMDYPVKQSPEKTNFAVERADKKTKENGLVVKDGKVYQNKGGELIEQTVPKGTAERVSGMLEIRGAAKALQNAQQQGLKDTEIKKARQTLNKLYDAFVKKHGFINSQANKNAIMGDPDRYSILALENWNPETKKATKADIFSKNTIAPNRTVTAAKDVAEGLIVSVNQTGGVDAALIAKLTDKTEAEVTRELLDSRAVFKNRDGGLETAEMYLSGNVRAKLRDAEAMVPLDSDYQKNVEALKAVVPEDVSYQDIFVNPGTPWIPNSVYSDFAAHMLGTTNRDWRQAITVTRNKDTGNFVVELKEKYLKTNSYNTQKWGTNRRSFLDLFDAMLNSKSVVVKYKTDDGKSVVDQDATAAANEKVEAIQKEFQEWLWKDEARREELAILYNETFNSIVTPKYNGDNLTVNGANAMKPLRPHQRDAVQRIISSGGNTLLAHKVGAGKTYEMAAAAMKLKELGLVKKPLFAVPKSLVAQWGNEFVDFFPTAKLLVAEASDFTAANRKIFANRIANGDYDAVIVSYEQFEKLPISADFARDLYQEQIDSIILAIEEAKAENGKSLSVKDLEKKRKSLETKIEKLTDTAKDEDNIEFEQLGVDSIFVDEAHNFKNLFYTTSMTNVSGLGNKDGSKRAFDLYTKVRYLQKLNGGRGIVFATATPVMNSMSEMYIMQKYLQPDLLDQLGLSTFDAWAKQFGEVVNGVEIKPSGQGYRVKQSFSRFKNMSELQLLFRNFADVLTDIPGLKIPKMKGGKVNVVVCEPGQFQQDYMKELEKRADNIKNVDPSVDNMLKITSDGRKISYTQRMIDPSLPYEEGCKIFRCADNVLEKYAESKDIKGTQIIFCDMATPKGKSSTTATDTEDVETDMESAKLYDDIKGRLVKGGIPAKEIAFIHEADTDAKKKKLFADVNDGKVRVLIGSTGKMGVGMNAQKRIVAIHHLDAPWRPGDVEQRNGRAYRQGNINDEVENFTYVTEGSFDARLWDILDRKQNFINQVMNGENVGRETEDTGEVTLSAAEVKALASGSPLIMEQVQLDTDIKKLESLRRAHRSAVTNAISRLERDKGRIATLEKMIENGKADTAARVDTYSEGKFYITIGNQKFTEKKDAGTALMAEATAKANEDGYTSIAQFAGFDLRVIKTAEGIKGLISGNQSYSFNTYPSNTTYMINHLVARVEEISEAVTEWEQELVQTRKDMAEQEKLMAQPFAKQAELDQKRARYNEVMEILNPKEEQALDSVAEDDVQYQQRDYLSEDENNDNRGIRTDAQGHSVVDGETSGNTVFGRGDRADGRGAQKDKEWGNLTKRVRTKILKSVQTIIATSKNYAEIRLYMASVAKKSVYDMTLADQQAAEEKLAEDIYTSIIDRANSRPLLESRWSFLGNISPIIEAIYGENVQFQQRTDTLTDRDVLAMAARDVDVSNLDSAEKDALRIFQTRLDKLQKLQEERAEQGRLYKEQQFGANVDRAAASETLNRMRVLDSQIRKASDDVLDVEKKNVLRSVLKKARVVVEQQERQRGQEILKRWRDRRNNAEAIKKYRDRLRGDVDELTNWVLHPDNKNVVKHIPDALKNTVVSFLSSINFMSKRSLGGGNATVADKAFMEQARRLAKVMEGTVNVDEMYSNYTDLPPDFMQNLRRFMDTAQDIVDSNSGDFIINQMTAEELQNLSKVVRTLKKYIMQMNRFHVNAMFKHVYEAGENSIDFLAQLKPAENTGKISNFVLWQQMRPAYAFERFGDGGKAVYDGLRRGQATLAFNTKKIQAFAEKAYTTAEVKAWEDQVKTIRLGPDKYVKMRVSHIMSLYELNKREQAQGHIFGGGIRVATFKAGNKKISDVGQTLTQGELNLILRELTPRQKEVADKLQQFMQQQGGEWGNYVTVARFGEKLFGEENYFPINSDGRHLSVDADEKPDGAALYALLNMGFTKQTQENAKNRIVVYSIFDVFANHMASMAQYNAFALPVVDALKWFNYERKSEPDENGYRTVLGSVREQMDRAFGVPEESKPGKGKDGYAQTFVVNIIKAFNGTAAQGTPYDGGGMKMLHRYNLAQVSYNFRVVVQQPLAITRAALLLDYSSIIKGMKLSPAAIRKNIQEMQRYSGIAAWKSLGFYDVNISRGLTSLIKHDDTWLDKVDNFGMWGAEKADTLTWAGIWSAAKEEVIRKQKLTPKSKGFYEAVTKLFEDVIYKTQVVDSVLTKNEFMRDKGFLAKSVGSFMSEPTTTASMLVDAYDKYHMDMQRGMTLQQAWKKNSKMIVRTAYVYGVGALILAAVQAVADAFRDDDDYQAFMEKWLEAFKGNVLDEVVPLNKLPWASQGYELLKELIAIWGGADIYGRLNNFVWVEIADNFIAGSKILADHIHGVDTNYELYGGVYKLLQAVSGISGLPMAAATREIITAWNNTVGAMAPSLKVKTYEPSEKAQIKYAYEDGYLTAEEAKQQLLQQNLVDTEDEAYWTIQGWEAGDGYSRYDAIYEAVRNGGDISEAMRELTSHGYTEKDILSQVKGTIGEWYKGGEITKQQATSMLSKYIGMDSEDITQTVNKWSSKVVTGIAFEDIKAEFLSGSITAARAVEMYMRYGGYTKDKATETVNKWRAEKETGVAYDDIKDAFMDGDISQGDAKNMYMTYGGLTEEKAAENVTVLAFVKKYPNLYDITYAAIEKYQTYCENVGVPAETFYDVWKFESNSDADVDANGESVSGSKKVKVLDYINSLDLASAQKDSLYYAFGWAESKISEAPWH